MDNKRRWITSLSSVFVGRWGRSEDVSIRGYEQVPELWRGLEAVVLRLLESRTFAPGVGLPDPGGGATHARPCDLEAEYPAAQSEG